MMPMGPGALALGWYAAPFQGFLDPEPSQGGNLTGDWAEPRLPIGETPDIHQPGPDKKRARPKARPDVGPVFPKPGQESQRFRRL